LISKSLVKNPVWSIKKYKPNTCKIRKKPPQTNAQTFEQAAKKIKKYCENPKTAKKTPPKAIIGAQYSQKR